jgi:hypothetical protein
LILLSDIAFPPHNQNQTVLSTLISAGEKLVEVRVYTEDSIEDAISGFFYVLLFPAGIIVPQTIVVEGGLMNFWGTSVIISNKSSLIPPLIL